MKLARKLTLALLLGVALILAVNAYFRVRGEVEQFESDMSGDARVMGRALGAAVAEVWRTDGEEAALRLVADANETASNVSIRWVFLDDGADEEHRPRLPLPLLDGLGDGPGHEIVQRRLGAGSGEQFLTYVAVRGSGPRRSALELSRSLAALHEYVRKTILDTLRAASIVALISALMTIALGVLFVGRPVRRLVEQARRVGAGDLSGRLRLPQRDELGELGREMNAMCERLARAKEQVTAEGAARLKAIEQLRHADRLATVGKLSSGIAHELGTPLLVVSGRARMIADGDLTGAEIPDSARIILEQSQRMTGIIRQLLDFGRRRGPERGTVDLHALVAETCTLLAPLAAKRRVKLRSEVPAAPAPARVDGEQIRQALTNLVVNGIDAMPKGGDLRVGLRAERRTPPEGTGAPEGEYLCLCVRDEGDGMDEETMSHVFEPFFTTKEVGQGTGLGLSVSYGIVREHGGFIAVESRPGAGSCFSTYLPLEPAEAPSGPPAGAPSHDEVPV
jgi:two-component system, NtrC family, sensor kinase